MHGFRSCGVRGSARLYRAVRVYESHMYWDRHRFTSRRNEAKTAVWAAGGHLGWVHLPADLDDAIGLERAVEGGEALEAEQEWVVGDLGRSRGSRHSGGGSWR